jgi:hypothetical protein
MEEEDNLIEPERVRLIAYFFAYGSMLLIVNLGIIMIFKIWITGWSEIF